MAVLCLVEGREMWGIGGKERAGGHYGGGSWGEWFGWERKASVI